MSLRPDSYPAHIRYMMLVPWFDVAHLSFVKKTLFNGSLVVPRDECKKSRLFSRNLHDFAGICLSPNPKKHS